MTDSSQERFGNTSEIDILRKKSGSPRRFLIFIRAGSGPRPSLFEQSLPVERCFDVALDYYAAPNARDALYSSAEFLVAGGLSKFHAAKQFLHAGYLDKYDGVYFLDDDLELHFDPSEFLTYCAEKRFAIAQAALTIPSDGAWKITFHHPGFEYRLTNFVEVMAPYFSKRFLMTVAESFDMSISTYGLDVFWGSQLELDDAAAIVDRFQMSHLKQRDLSSGVYYAYLQSIGVNCIQEMKDVLASLGLKEYQIRLKGGVQIVESVRVAG